MPNTCPKVFFPPPRVSILFRFLIFSKKKWSSLIPFITKGFTLVVVEWTCYNSALKPGHLDSNSSPPHAGCVNMGKLLDLPVLQFPPVQNGGDDDTNSNY